MALLKHLAKLDIPGGGQVVAEGGYAYVGHMGPPDGTSVIDVSDPRRPRVDDHLARGPHGRRRVRFLKNKLDKGAWPVDGPSLG